ncbi:hypothetical protein V6N13_123934 [Hibiscus sabdariffa]|uniref:Uncharacterized protein n=1 Tax=Hibiscus sabdariffa TaxID=183260 RepID=A0ABR2N930_9ROSI
MPRCQGHAQDILRTPTKALMFNNAGWDQALAGSELRTLNTKTRPKRPNDRTMTSMGTKKNPLEAARCGKHVDQATKLQPQRQQNTKEDLRDRTMHEPIQDTNGGPAQRGIQGTKPLANKASRKSHKGIQGRKPLAKEIVRKEHKQAHINGLAAEPTKPLLVYLISVNSTTICMP